MADTLTFAGSITSRPLYGNPSGFPTVLIPINETMTLSNMQIGQYVLINDTPVSVDLGGVTDVNVLVVKCVGGKISVTVTSDDGTDQIFPVDGLLFLQTRSVPITAISITGQDGS